MASELVSIGRIIEALHQMLGYEVTQETGGLVVLDIPESGVRSPFPLVFDKTRGTVPIEDVLGQIEAAGIDRAVFLAHLDALP